MAYSNSDEIFITMHADDKEAFYAKIPYDKLPSIHRIGGKWMQSGKEWRFPLDDQIWEKFQKEFASEFATGKVHKDAAFLLAFDKRHKDLDKFLKFKEVAMRDEPTDFGVEGVSLNGKNCLFNYQRWGVQCGLTVGDGFLIGDSMGLGKCLASSNLCNFNVGIRRVSDVVDNLDEDRWYKSDDGIGEWHEIDDLKILGNDRGKEAYFPVRRAYRERVPSVAEVKLQNGLENIFGWNHKFFTNHGWKAVHELSESDWVLVNERIVPNATVHYNDDDIFWLAWQIGEGSDCSFHTHSISNTDLSLLQKLKSCIEAHRQEVVLNGNGKASYVVSIHEDCRHIEGHKDKYSLNFNYRYTECLHRIFGYKMHTKSGDKEIPMSILNSDDENARLFIRCMWDAEGCCNKSNLELSSKSYDVIEKMWYLLKRFGIFGIVSSKMARVKSGRNKYWKLLVGGIYARRFKDEIGFSTPHKQEALERLCGPAENTNIGMSSPCKELLNHLVVDVLETSYNIVGIDSGKLHGHYEYGAGKVRKLVDNIGRIVNEGVYRKKSKWSHLEDRFNRNRIERKQEIEEILSILRKYYIGGHQWLKVVSVKTVDCNEGFYVYDFEVNDCNHNYYASGMLTHNTIQGLGIAKERMNRGEVRNCLIVCPASLKYNWRDEISKFLNMDALVIGHKCKNAQDREKQWIATGYPFKIVNYETVARDLYCEPKKNDNRISCAKAVLNSFDMVVFDECFSYYSRVMLEDGSLEYIGKIVTHKLPVKVMSYNWETRQFEAKPVVNYFDNGRKPLLQLKTQYGTVQVTENHKYYRMDGTSVLAGELKVGDKIAIYNKFGFSNEILPLLAGTLLGDGLLGRNRENDLARYHSTHGMKQLEYANFKEMIFGNCRGREYMNDYEKGFGNRLHSSCSKSMFPKHVYDIFYKNGKKKVTQEWLDLLNEFGLALWYMDDGSIQQLQYHKNNIQKLIDNLDYICEHEHEYQMCASKKSCASYYKKKLGLKKIECDTYFRKMMSSEDRMAYLKSELNTIAHVAFLHTEGFSKEEVELMSNHLKTRFGLSNSIVKTKNKHIDGEFYYHIRFTIDGTKKLIDIVSPYVVDSMRYKLGGIGRQYDDKLVKSSIKSNGLFETEVISVEPWNNRSNYTYNIEVEGNHNYICGGSLVSNCHMLKHHSSQRTLACRQFNAKYRVGLTGTPLDGRLEEIHSIFQILKPGLFVSKQKFMERYAEYDYFGAVKGYHHIKEVSDKIAPYYLRRLKEEVLKDLPPKIHKDMMVELSPKNMKAYKDLVKKKNEITENASAMELVMRARQFLDFPEILGLHNSSDKYAVFKELLDELVKENNHKVIIFSQYTNTLHWLMKNLESEYKNILVIDGSVDPEERQEICKKFNSDQKYRILLGSNAMSTGLNLQAADDVINYTADFSPAIMKQREDRAYRCGVTHTVTVYDFVCMDTVDERVRNILTRKQTVNNALLGENVDSFEVGDMSAMEILSCL